MNKVALLSGINGQTASYLAELLLSKNYEVHGIIRRASLFNTARIDHIFDKIHLHYGDLGDSNSLCKIIRTVSPDEIYHLGAMSMVRVSFDIPEYCADITGTGTLRILEATRDFIQSSGKQVKIYNACSSEMFGSTPPPQNELTPFHPRSPYAVAKVASYWYGVNYREAYNMFICNGIMFNNESERRGETFVTRKITRALGRIHCGLQNELLLGNLDAKRDWGHSSDTAEAIYLMLQHSTPDDYVVATGEMHSIREFLDESFGLLKKDWTKYVKTDPKYLRPSEVDGLCGDSSKIRNILGWAPKVGFKELVKRMVDHDLMLATNEAVLKHQHLYNMGK